MCVCVLLNSRRSADEEADDVQTVGDHVHGRPMSAMGAALTITITMTIVIVIVIVIVMRYFWLL